MNYVYLLRCVDGTLYCGWTTDLEARLQAHNSGKGAKYTRSRLPVELVYSESYEDRHDALSREWHLKRMTRDEKLALIHGARKNDILIRKASGEEMLALWGYPKHDAASPTARFFYQNITAGNAVFWALEHEGELIGELYAFFDLEDKDFADGKTTAYLCAFRVKDGFRGQGLGSRLMETALTELRALGFRRATIGASESEPQNLRLYHRFGFTEKVKDCRADPCAMDENMQPAVDPEPWALLYKEL